MLVFKKYRSSSRLQFVVTKYWSYLLFFEDKHFLRQNTNYLLQLFRSFLAVPSPIPSEPVVKDSGRNWVSLSWDKPDQTSIAPVLAYRVDMWHKGSDGGAHWATLGVSSLTGFDAFNLVTGGEYQFRVTPRNR